MHVYMHVCVHAHALVHTHAQDINLDQDQIPLLEGCSVSFDILVANT